MEARVQNRSAGRRLDLDQQRVALAAARADRGEAEAATVAAQLMHHRAEDSGAAGADRVAERNRPPFTFTRSGSAPSSFAEFSTTDENASFSSMRSTSPIVLPALSSAIAPAFAGVRAR